MGTNNYMDSESIIKELQGNVQMHINLLKDIVFILENMDIKEINKKLEDKNISLELRLALEKRKEILLTDKEVKK